MQFFMSIYGGQLKQQICYSFTLLTSYMVFNPFIMAGGPILFCQDQQASGHDFRKVAKSLAGNFACFLVLLTAAELFSKLSFSKQYSFNTIKLRCTPTVFFLCVCVFFMTSQQLFSHEGQIFLCWTRTIKQRIKYLAQGHNAVHPVRLEPATPQSREKHSTTEPPHFSRQSLYINVSSPWCHGFRFATFCDIFLVILPWYLVKKKSYSLRHVIGFNNG